jgi:uncharacterized protein YyaL (SSP411 family)
MSNELGGHPNLYLRQHGNNPVHWKAWGKAAWEKAAELNRLVVVSIGYSACHWCHVMEKNCFEDEEVGQYMNQHFIAIKVDREERPDVDSIYMSAIHAMGKNGGWPLNCVCLPDGRPIFAGTYIPKQKWLQTLQELHHLFIHDHDTVLDFAHQLESHLKDTRDWFDSPLKEEIPFDFDQWLNQLDHQWGGTIGSPKFPMPPLILFVLRKSVATQNTMGLTWVRTTLSNMILGGLWDWIDGGFSRYSVDERWHIPHFEKMLYDNAQLLEVYTLAKQWIPDEKWDIVTHHTRQWINDFLLTDKGLYYSATDADSEGEEGKYFCFDVAHMKNLLGHDYEEANFLFDFENNSYWENNQCVLRLKDYDQHIPYNIFKKLFTQRRLQIRPIVDNKVLLSWNALLLNAMAQEPESLPEAVALWSHLKKELHHPQGWVGTLYPNGTAAACTLNALAFLQKALITLLFQTSDGIYWKDIIDIQQTIEKRFKDATSVFFFSSDDSPLFLIPKDLHDSVIPSANAVIAENLYWMGIIDANPLWVEQSKTMTYQRCQALQNPMSSAHWWQVKILFEQSASVIAGNIIDPATKKRLLLHKYIETSYKTSDLNFLKNKPNDSKVYYVCNSETCYPPTSDISHWLYSSLG